MNYIKAFVVIVGIVGSYIFLLNMALGQGIWH
jgi:hypothetical protein